MVRGKDNKLDGGQQIRGVIIGGGGQWSRVAFDGSSFFLAIRTSSVRRREPNIAQADTRT